MSNELAASFATGPPPPPPLVACVNSSEDVAQLLAEWLRTDGFRAVAYITPIRYGAEPIIQFITELRPDACVYTVAIPYRESWAEFEQLHQAAPDVAFVLTTTNQRAFEQLVQASYDDA